MSEEGRRLKERTREFALQVIHLYAALPKSVVAQTLGKQLLRSGTSVGAHYREGTRSRSHAEFVSKLEGALQELEKKPLLVGVARSGTPGAGGDVGPAGTRDGRTHRHDHRQRQDGQAELRKAMND